MTANEQSTAAPTPAPTAAVTGERADLLAILARQRDFLRVTVRDLTDDQARQRTTDSELTLGGLIKHVSSVERNWAEFIVKGPAAMPDFNAMTEADWAAWADAFKLLPDETLAGVLDEYERTARHTDELVSALPSLDDAQPLPEAPWFEGASEWTARRVILHLIAETAQHSGHADIIRESLDGRKTMG